MSENVNISGLDKADVLAALYNASRPMGMGFLSYDSTPMTAAHAQQLLDTQGTYYDYLMGRVMKVDLSGDDFDPWGYDRDNGARRAQEVINELRDGGETNSVTLQAMHTIGRETAADNIAEHNDTSDRKH